MQRVVGLGVGGSVKNAQCQTQGNFFSQCQPTFERKKNDNDFPFSLSHAGTKSLKICIN